MLVRELLNQAVPHQRVLRRWEVRRLIGHAGGSEHGWTQRVPEWRASVMTAKPEQLQCVNACASRIDGSGHHQPAALVRRRCEHVEASGQAKSTADSGHACERRIWARNHLIRQTVDGDAHDEPSKSAGSNSDDTVTPCPCSAAWCSAIVHAHSRAACLPYGAQHLEAVPRLRRNEDGKSGDTDERKVTEGEAGVHEGVQAPEEQQWHQPRLSIEEQ